MNESSSSWLPVVIAPSLVLLLTACHQEPATPAKVELPAANVPVIEVRAVPATRFERVPGTVIARQQAAIEAKLTGRVTALHVEPGTRVNRGDLVAELDAPEIAARVEQARAAFALAEKDHQRTSRLFARGAATRSELDAATGRLDQARAALAEAESLLSHARVTAPFAGVVARKQIEVGDLATPGRALLTLESPDGRQFLAGVPESLMNGVRAGVTNRIRFHGDEAPVAGVVAEVNPAGDPASRSWQVKWNLPVTGVRSGAFGEVELAAGETAELRVPVAAVLVRGQLEQVFVVDQGRAVLRLIKTGARDGDQLTVLSGLTGGELLITTPKVVSDGQPVNR